MLRHFEFGYSAAPDDSDVIAVSNTKSAPFARAANLITATTIKLNPSKWTPVGLGRDARF